MRRCWVRQDRLRGIAVILVVIGHMGIDLLHTAGGVGVAIFFALSGFLITTLLLEEREDRGTISLSRFYARRALRLLPALVLFLATMGAVARLGDKPTLPTGPELLGALFYVSNYTTGMQGRDTVIGHTWSLSVEEQFYLVWPVIVIVAMAGTRGRAWLLAAIATAGCAASLVLRAVLWDDGAGQIRVYYGTDTRMDCLLLGALAAIWIQRRPVGRDRVPVALIALAAIALLCLGKGRVEYLLVPFVVPVLTVVVILCVVQGAGTRVLTNRPLVLVGQRSYGIYLWHFPFVGTAAMQDTYPAWAAIAVALVLTALITHLSWRCVEEPFLALKSRLGARRGTPAPADTNESRPNVTPGALSV